MLEIEFGVVMGLGQSIEEVRDKRNRIPILASDGVETMVVHAKLESTILLFDKKDRSSSGRVTWANEAVFEIVIQKLSEHIGLAQAELVDTAKRWCFSVFKINLQIIRTMQREFISKSFREDVSKIVVLIWNIELLKFFRSWNLGIGSSGTGGCGS